MFIVVIIQICVDGGTMAFLHIERSIKSNIVYKSAESSGNKVVVVLVNMNLHVEAKTFLLLFWIQKVVFVIFL